ncbi:MAG: hypothetical protein IJB74_05035 [Clostridia bacterium]|nr:hypothetical protein [Clostridia bacterium]
MKKTVKFLSLAMAVLMLFGIMNVSAYAGEEKEYTIISPYKDVIWEGENAWGAYKGTLHSHSTYSDADESLDVMVKEYYEQDYDFLANSDHGVTGTPWNEKQPFVPLYFYQAGKTAHLTDEEFEGITSGTYPLYDGTVRGKGMTCVTGANELNNLTLTKSHVNGYFLPEGAGNGFGGMENGFELAIKFIEDKGGLSHINHPGDWLESNANPSAVSDPENVAFFADLLLKYESCLGIEVFNENNGVTGYDRILWDNLLMSVLPYGKNVIGFSNTDAHNRKNVDTSFSVFMMEENTVENIKETMQSGSFFAVTRCIRGNDLIGPEKDIDVRNQNLPYPIFTKVEVHEHNVTVEAENADKVQFIADGKAIYTAKADGEVTLELDKIDGAEDFQYVRAELFGEGGVCLTQALIIDDGSEKAVYEEDKSLSAFIEDILFLLKSTRLWTIIVEIGRLF